ncbi:hypothetical protein DFJ74DRAFT_40352 [Hyaloraphidium curvatum]|nr:hypothetical protein DFJ74DRAFT_40352 [Hyaloraphidium curvatum]
MPVADSLFGSWQEVAGCGWRISNSSANYDTYVNTIYVAWTDYFDGRPRNSSVSYPVVYNLPREVNISTNTSLAAESGIRNLRVTGFNVAFQQDATITVALDYQVYTRWPFNLVFTSVAAPNTTAMRDLPKVTALDPVFTVPAACMANPPANNASGLPVNTTDTQCWQSGRAVFTLPASVCAGPGAVADIGGVYAWEFRSECFLPQAGRPEQGFAVSDCRSAIQQAGTSIQTAGTDGGAGINVCEFGALAEATGTLSVEMKSAGGPGALPGDDRDTYFFGDEVLFVANATSTIVDVHDLKLVELTVAKLGSVNETRDPATPGFNETLGKGNDGFGTPNYLRRLGTATGLNVRKLDNATLRIALTPNMGPSLEGYFVTTRETSDNLGFTFYARFMAVYEGVTPGGRRRRLVRAYRTAVARLARRADFEVGMPDTLLSQDGRTEYPFRLAMSPTATGTVPTPTGTEPTPAPQPSGGLSTGAIIGIAVGGVAAAGLIGAGIALAVRRKPTPAKKPEPDEEGFVWHSDEDSVGSMGSRGDRPHGPEGGAAAAAAVPAKQEMAEVAPPAGGPPGGALAGLGDATLAGMLAPTGSQVHEGAKASQAQLPTGALEGLGAATLAGLVAPTVGQAHQEAARPSQLPAGALDGLGAATLAGMVAPVRSGEIGEHAEDLPKGVLAGLGDATLAGLLGPAGAGARGREPTPPSLPVNALAGLGEATLAGMLMPGGDVSRAESDDHIFDPRLADELPHGALQGLGAETLANLVPAVDSHAARDHMGSPSVQPPGTKDHARSPSAQPPAKQASPYLDPVKDHGRQRSEYLQPTQGAQQRSRMVTSPLPPMTVALPTTNGSPMLSPASAGQGHKRSPSQLKDPWAMPQQERSRNASGAISTHSTSPAVGPVGASGSQYLSTGGKDHVRSPTPSAIPVGNEQHMRQPSAAVPQAAFAGLGEQTLANMRLPEDTPARQPLPKKTSKRAVTSSGSAVASSNSFSSAPPPAAVQHYASGVPDAPSGDAGPAVIPREVMDMLGARTLTQLVGPNGASMAADVQQRLPPESETAAQRLEKSLADLQNLLGAPSQQQTETGLAVNWDAHERQRSTAK